MTQSSSRWRNFAREARHAGARAVLALAAAVSFSTAAAPYSGTPIAAPGTFEAENFDKGGEGIGYHDFTAGNAGGQYRTSESVDIVASRDAAGGGYVVNYFQTGEWLAYTINVPADGNYDIAIRAANKRQTGAAFHAEIDGVNVTGKVSVPSTGGWNRFQWFGKTGVPLKAGTHVLKVVSDQQYFDANQVRIAANASSTPPAYSYSGTPYSGTPIAVPKAFEAEDFDKGGNNVAYRDLSAGNAGGQYRTADSVDIIASSDSAGGGYVVNYFQTGEWLAYTLNIPADGNYDVSIRAANKDQAGAGFHAEIDGVDVTGKVLVPATGAWSSFQWFGRTGVPLKAGKRILKIVADQQYFNVNAISVLAGGTTTPTTAANQPPTVSFKAPTSGATLSGTVNSTSCEVNAADDAKVVRVDFFLGATALAPKTAAPWQCAIDTTKFNNGSYQLKAVAYDEQGTSNSAAVSVNVQNSTTPPATTEPAAISGKGYRLVKNWDFVSGIRSITALQAEFYPFYVYSNGTLNYLGREWERYRDFTNGNHVFTAEGLALRAFLRSGQPLAAGNIDSGMLRSKWYGKYGYYEVRMKVPGGLGMWPAFWLNPQDQTWPPEIDVVEIVNNGRDTTANSFHYVHGVGTKSATFSLLDQWGAYRPGFDYKDGFHTFAVEWTADRVRHFVDDKLVVERPYTWLHDNGSDGGPAHVLLNLAVGGDWPGAPTASSLPADLVVKYMRVWQK